MATIKLSTVIARIRRAIAPPNGKDVSINDALGKHFRPLNSKALAGTLNRRNAFKTDGLRLRSSDTQNAKTVRDLVIAVENWYKNNGWTVQ